MVELIDRWETRQTTIWGRYGSSWPKTDERIMEARGTFEPNRSTLRSKFFKLFCNNMFRIIPICLKFESLQKKYFFQLYIYKERLKRFVSWFFLNIYLSKILTDEQRNKMSFLTESCHFFVCLICICLFAFCLKILLVCFNVV